MCIGLSMKDKTVNGGSAIDSMVSASL